MRRPSVPVILSILILVSYGADAQQASVPPTPPNDRRPYLGNPVTHPEALSGLWEASNRHGGAVGIHLLLTTTVPVDQCTCSRLWSGD
jgi:hypothetical protein